MVDRIKGHCGDCRTEVMAGNDTLCEGGACSDAVARFTAYVEAAKDGHIGRREAAKIVTHRETKCPHRDHDHQ